MTQTLAYIRVSDDKQDVKNPVLPPRYNWLFQLFGEANVIFSEVHSKIRSSYHRKLS